MNEEQKLLVEEENLRIPQHLRIRLLTVLKNKKEPVQSKTIMNAAGSNYEAYIEQLRKEGYIIDLVITSKGKCYQMKDQKSDKTLKIA